MFRTRFRVAAIGVVVLLGIAIAISRSPSHFPEHTFFTVNRGDSVSTVTTALEEGGYIRSPLLFKLTMRLVQGNIVQTGVYYFEERESVHTVASRLGKGRYGIDPIAITIPEGFTAEAMSELFEKNLPHFDDEAFLLEAREMEGYLFPDTYHFLPTTTTDEVLEQLQRTFREKTRLFEEEARKQSRAWSDVIIMASIIEKEVSDSRDRRMVSDILWRRLDEGMRLQVDAPFLYTIGKTSENSPKKI
jgi:UPF0755 protein